MRTYYNVRERIFRCYLSGFEHEMHDLFTQGKLEAELQRHGDGKPLERKFILALSFEMDDGHVDFKFSQRGIGQESAGITATIGRETYEKLDDKGAVKLNPDKGAFQLEIVEIADTSGLSLNA